VVLTGPMPGVSSPPKDGRGVERSKQAKQAAPAARERAPKRNVTPTPVHHKDIREPSRERLLEILREADGTEGR
jgi:hypothetical protein